MQVNVQTPKLPVYFAGQADAPTIQELVESYNCDNETACALLDLAEWGYSHGVQGQYPDGDYACWAEWDLTVAAHIRQLEFQLDVDDDSVYKIYQDAHAAGLALYEQSLN